MASKQEKLDFYSQVASLKSENLELINQILNNVQTIILEKSQNEKYLMLDLSHILIILHGVHTTLTNLLKEGPNAPIKPTLLSFLTRDISLSKKSHNDAMSKYKTSASSHKNTVLSEDGIIIETLKTENLENLKAAFNTYHTTEIKKVISSSIRINQTLATLPETPKRHAATLNRTTNLIIKNKETLKSSSQLESNPESEESQPM